MPKFDLKKSREEDLKRGMSDATIYRIGHERYGIQLSPGERGRVAMLGRIEALEWLVEVLEWKPRGTYGRSMGANGWHKQKTWPDRQESYNSILAKARSDAGYGE